MDILSTLNDAQVVLLATLLTSDYNLSQLQVLASERKDVLTEPLLCRLLLTYLPILADNESSLTTFLVHLQNEFEDVSSLDIAVDTYRVEFLSTTDVRQRLHELRFKDIEVEDLQKSREDLGTFLVDYIHQRELICGLSAATAQLIDSLAESQPYLRQWRDSFLLPLIRLQNDFYPGRADTLDLKAMETLHGLHGVKTLLQFAEQDRNKAQIGRDLHLVVSPWVQGSGRAKRRRLSHPSPHEQNTSWQDVNEWLLIISRTDFSLAANAIIEWDGPTHGTSTSILESNGQADESHTRYAQTALALLLSSPAADVDKLSLFKKLFDRATSLAASLPASDYERNPFEQSSRADLLDNAMLLPTNSLTYPSDDALSLLHTCLSEQTILFQNFKISTTIASLAELALFSAEEKQIQQLTHVLEQTLRMTNVDIDWSDVRRKIHLLHADQNISSNSDILPNLHCLGRVSSEYIETQILDTVLTTDQYSAVKELYIDNPDTPLNTDIVKARVVASIFNAYDNASNGNRNRGGMKRASDLMNAFRSQFAGSKEFSQIEYLIRATHSLSFYQLTLQHGVPFQPVNIRVNQDPLSLIEKALKQTAKAYTKLDDLTEIGLNLVRAGLPQVQSPPHDSESMDEKVFNASNRITYLAIRSALADNDFDTAYSYITTRLSTNSSQTQATSFTDDTSWRAAYEAGKHRPSNSPKNLHDRIASLSKRMDLLSLALTLAPISDVLPEILSTWRRNEEEMDNLKARAIDEERAFEAQGDSTIPGGFGPEDRELDAAETRRLQEKRALNGTAPTYEEEAPMGLFDVARGAASALRKSAFPLRGAGSDQFKVRQAVAQESPRSSMDESRDGQQRVRKRDMVSSMVTGGLVSGMSWMLGAPAAAGAHDEHDER